MNNRKKIKQPLAVISVLVLFFALVVSMTMTTKTRADSEAFLRAKSSPQVLTECRTVANKAFAEARITSNSRFEPNAPEHAADSAFERCLLQRDPSYAAEKFSAATSKPE